jgi:hypothetical protein
MKLKIIGGLVLAWLCAATGSAQDAAKEAFADIQLESPLPMQALALQPEDVHALDQLADEQLNVFVKMLAATPQIPFEKMPRKDRVGTFYSLQHSDWPPLPADTIHAPVWKMEGFYLLNDLDMDYDALAPPQTKGKLAKSLGAPGEAGGSSYGGDGSSESAFGPSDYGTNLWIAQPAVKNQFLTGIGTNTLADVQYEIQSRTNLAQPDWQTEGFILGSEIANWTPLSVAQNHRTNLFIRLRSWADDGSGLPLWWQLQYFGHTGVDPYGNPAGDGWSNLQKFQNGWNPNQFYTPPAPQGLTATYNMGNNSALVNWQPSAGTATNYQVRRTTEYDNYNNTGTTWITSTNDYTISASSPFLQNGLGGLITDLTSFVSGPAVKYQVRAKYVGGQYSGWSAKKNLRPDTIAARLIPGGSNQTFLAVGNVPPNTTTIRLYYFDYDAIRWYLQPPINFTNDIPYSAFTDGVFQLPDSWHPPNYDAYGPAMSGYQVYAQAITTGNVPGGYQFVFQGVEWVPPFHDARRQLKDNLIFQLRVADANQPFHYFAQDVYDPDIYHLQSNPASATVSSYITSEEFYDQNNVLQYEADISSTMPYKNNYLYRNFVFDPSNLDGEGAIQTGLQIDRNGHYLDTPPANVFQAPAGAWGTVPSVLTTNQTRWLTVTPLAQATSLPLLALQDFTFPHAPPYYQMLSNVKNFYGLPYVSIMTVTNSANLNVLYPGNTASFYYIKPYLYYEAAQPQFQVVEYDFWNQSAQYDPVSNTTRSQPTPDDANFAVTNKSDVFFIPVGNRLWLDGYAKMIVANGYTNKFCYLGQYFDKAYKVGQNGVATTNVTGFLSGYGTFFATEPGDAALTTMPDPDTGARGTGIVHCVSLNVDKNHDGLMDLSFNGPDATSQASPMGFWVNNGFSGVNGNLATVGGIRPNYTYGQIISSRDLENFARLWICGMPVMTNGNCQITLSWSSFSTNGYPAINLYESVETNGGTGYLTDTNIAMQQSTAINIATNYGNSPYFVGPGVALGAITPNAPFVFSTNYFSTIGTKHFLFEGAGIGSGVLTLTVAQNGHTLVQTGVGLDLRDPKDLYEQVHTANIDNAPPSSKVATLVKDKMLAATTDEDPQAIIFVHGINNSQFDYYDSSETMFKRLYWQGYRGRFCAFRWPSPLFKAIPTSASDISYLGFNQGEYISWHSGAALKAYIDDLHSRLTNYTVNLAAHSLGNVAANEAIREGAQVDNYALMQAAISAGAFDGNNTALNYSYLTDSSLSNSPAANALGGYNNCATNATRRVNFYNDDDWALFRGPLQMWEGNQHQYKPDHTLVNPGWEYLFNGTNCLFRYTDENGLPLSSQIVTEDFEKKAYIARSRTKAVGAAGLKYQPNTLTHGSITNSISLQDSSLGFVGGAAFGATRPDHSGEFTKTIQNTVPFYKQLLNNGFLILQNP